MNAEFNEFLAGMRGKRVTVIGMGVSNKPLILLLLDSGAHVLVCDKKENHDKDFLADLKRRGAEFSFGSDYLAPILNSEIIFKTPGMRYDCKELVKAEKKGITVTTEMEKFLEFCKATSIGITGSDGKTTTTTIVGKLLAQAGKRAFVGGNIGTPLFAKSNEIEEKDFAVIELSSFQLMNIKQSPDIAVITNVTPNHLDVHKSMEEYTLAKENIFRFSGGRVVLNYDNEITQKIAAGLGKRAVLFSSHSIIDDGYCIENSYIVRRTAGESRKVLKIADIKIPGMHNVENYMAAIAAVEGIVSDADIAEVAKSFGGVEHRMELVREKDGVKYYNDSIASSPTRTIAGLRAFNDKVILIAGGYDKHIPFDVLGDAVLKYTKAVVLVGATSEKISHAIKKAYGYDEKKLPLYICESFEDAVHKASEIARSGDIVTLSPACASFDLFENFMARGERFKEIVNSL